ncbi:unnamed protein product, partial [Staurois parvus]
MSCQSVSEYRHLFSYSVDKVGGVGGACKSTFISFQQSPFKDILVSPIFPNWFFNYQNLNPSTPIWK